MSMELKQKVLSILAAIQVPLLGNDLVSAKVVKEIDVKEGQVTIALELGFPCKGIVADLKSQICKQVLAVANVKQVNVSLKTRIVPHRVQQGLKGLSGVKNIIAIASGKGGVGKSTTAINLAYALQAEGARVGLLDADIYGPSQPLMLGVKTQPESKEGKYLYPIDCNGLQTMSIGYLLQQDDTPMIWRGPMVTSALQQLLNETLWEGLDYLIVDLPPGTGDIQLTLAQKIPVSGALIVTTPQDLALLDARKALRMFEKVKISVLGIVENMSTYICPACGHQADIFGAGGGQSMAKQYSIDLLGSLPLAMNIREKTDDGNPIVWSEPESEISQIYRQVARSAAAKLSLQSRDYSSKFPNIVIENK